MAETENLNYSERQCFEDFLLYLHRIENNYSTLANHGRFHPGWVRPSNKGARRKMVRSSKPVSYDSIAKVVKGKKYNSNEWLGLKWSAPVSLAEVKSQSQAGIYKIFNSKEMLYCGETKNMTSRLSSHKINKKFLNSFVSYHLMPGAPAHHLKEREVDMIGSYFEEFGYGPKFQYRPTGKKK
ncbi:GIY-YIG nuclease family protein [Acidobacteriota bacterium]